MAKPAQSERTKSAKAKRAFRMPPTITLPELLDDGSDHRFRRLIYDLTRLSDIVSGARRHLADALDLNPPQYSIMMLVAEYAGEVDFMVSEVAARLHVSGAFVTSQVNRLVELELLEKSPHPIDGRSVLLRLTSKGQGEIERAAPMIRAFNDEFFGAMTRKQFDAFAAAVSILIQTGEKALVRATTERDLPASARRAILRRQRR